VSGGTLYASNVVLSNNTAGLILSNNGTLIARANTSLISGTGTVTLAGNGRIDAATDSVTNSANMTGEGALTVNGSGGTGTLTLSGNNGSLSGSVVVGNNSTLVLGTTNAAGTGTVSLGASSTLASTVTGSSTISLGGLTLSNSTLSIQTAIYAPGLVSFNGSTNLISVTGTNGSFGNLPIGTNVVISSGLSIITSGTVLYANSSVLGSTTLSLNGSSATFGRTTYSFTNAGLQLQLLAVGGAMNLAWSGSSSSFWNTTDANWISTNSPVPTTFFAGDSAAFTNLTSTNIQVGAAGITAGTITVSNSTVTFGGGTLTGTALTIGSNSSVTVTNALSGFAGGVTGRQCHVDIGGFQCAFVRCDHHQRGNPCPFQQCGARHRHIILIRRGDASGSLHTDRFQCDQPGIRKYPDHRCSRQFLHGSRKRYRPRRSCRQ